MRIIRLTRSQEALVDDEDYDFVNQWNWMANSNNHGGFYAVRKQRINRVLTTIPLHDVIAERMGLVGRIDHKDRNSLNNQRNNIRIATQHQNARNSSFRANNTSGFRGVTWDKNAQRWKAQIRVERQTRGLGLYTEKIQAAMAYDRAAKRLFGEFAVLNFPDS